MNSRIATVKKPVQSGKTMNKRPLIPVEGVSNIELFYDLIFAYCISVLTTLCGTVDEGFIDVGTWFLYMFSFLVVLQIWFYSTVIMNHFGDRSIPDSVCLFINMFLLYYMASGVAQEWNLSLFTFDVAWVLILANLVICCISKLATYDNLNDVDLLLLIGTTVIMAIQIVIALIAAFSPFAVSVVLSWIAMLGGANMWWLMRRLSDKPVRFAHITERCSLLVIVMFGQTVVSISSYITMTSSVLYPIFVFALVVGLFLIYIYEHDNMLDHQLTTSGVGYLHLTVWLVIILGNLTVALGFMPMRNVAFLPKNIYLVAFLVLYLLASFILGRYNKPEFRYSLLFVVGRVGVCAAIVVVSIATNFDSMATLVFDTCAVFFALWHEWLLYHNRTGNLRLGKSLGEDD